MILSENAAFLNLCYTMVHKAVSSMRIIDYQGIKLRQRRRAARKRMVRRGFIALVATVFTITYIYIALQIPLPEARAVSRPVSSNTATQTNIAWPGYGQSALGNPEYGLLESNGSQEAAPTASVAKIMTALAVLRKKPIVAGQPIPRLIIDEVDVAAYQYYSANDGSNIRVEAGQELTEYQALQALLLPSANNIAETLARWAFGSIEAYSTYANDLARSLGMRNSFFAEPSGFSPRTVSTASDLVLLGLAAMNEPTIADIVAQPSAVLPVAGEIRNTNRVLGQQGIVGVKTGNTDEAGGCFMVAGKHTFQGQTILTVGVIMGAPTIGKAMTDSVSLLASAVTNYKPVRVATRSQVVADYQFAWQSGTTAYITEDVEVLSWVGSDVAVNLAHDAIEEATPAGVQVGSLNAASPLQKKTTPIYLQQAPTKPPLSWRLKRLIGLT